MPLEEAALQPRPTVWKIKWLRIWMLPMDAEILCENLNSASFRQVFVQISLRFRSSFRQVFVQCSESEPGH